MPRPAPASRRQWQSRVFSKHENAGRIPSFNEFSEVDGHYAAIMRDEHSVLLGTQFKDLRVVDSSMKAEVWSSLEVNWSQPLSRSKDVFVQIVVCLKPDFHSGVV
jgi:hypothetical protein